MFVINDWTEHADFSEPRKTGDHHHSRTDEPIDTRHAIIDYAPGEQEDAEGNLITEPYDFYYKMNASGNSHWPWDDPPNGESRDAESLDLVAVPGYEFHFGTHTYALFSTAANGDTRKGGIPEKHQDTIDNRRSAEAYPEPVVGFAHVGRYDPTGDGFDAYRHNTGRLAEQNEPVVIGTGRNSNWPHEGNRELWDLLLHEFGPDYLPMKVAHNDPLSGGTVGQNLDRRWYSILMDPADYDVSDQVGSRNAAREAVGNRAVLTRMRDSWDADSESAPQPPQLTDAGVDGDTIYVETDADTVEWVSDAGNIVETGENVGASDGTNYLRAELWNSDESALTLTQAWGIDQS